MPSNWRRKRILKEGLGLNLLQKCPSFEKAKSSSFTADIWQALTVQYYGCVTKPHLCKIRQLHYIHQKVATNLRQVRKRLEKIK